MISLHFKAFQRFTVNSARDRVPWLIKDPKFTRKGIIRKKSRNIQYDLTQPHIVNPHLYYNASVDNWKVRTQAKERRRISRNLVSPSERKRSLQEILDETLRRDILDKPSKRILVNLLELESRFSENEFRDVAILATKRICSKPIIFSCREFGIATALANKYIPYEKEIWQKLRDYLFSKIETMNYKEEFLSESSQELNLVNCISTIVTRCAKLSLDFTFISESLRKHLLLAKDKPISNSTFTKIMCAILKKGIKIPDIPEKFQDEKYERKREDEKILAKIEDDLLLQEEMEKIVDSVKQKASEFNAIDSTEFLTSLSKGKIHNEELISILSSFS